MKKDGMKKFEGRFKHELVPKDVPRLTGFVVRDEKTNKTVLVENLAERSREPHLLGMVPPNIGP